MIYYYIAAEKELHNGLLFLCFRQHKNQSEKKLKADNTSEMAKEKKIYRTSGPVDRTEFSKFTGHFQILSDNTPHPFPR